MTGALLRMRDSLHVMFVYMALCGHCGCLEGVHNHPWGTTACTRCACAEWVEPCARCRRRARIDYGEAGSDVLCELCRNDRGG
jgi:hypothetical protein